MPAPTAPLLPEIAQKLRDNQLILFVGSGMSAPYFPTWSKLVDNLRKSAFSTDPTASAEVEQMIAAKQFLPAAWAIQEKAGDGWRDQIEATFSGNPRTANTTLKQAIERRYHALRGLPFLSYVTTNYDDFLVGALGQNAITHADTKEVAGMPANHKLLKLHGDANKPDTLILTSTDFSTMKFDRAAVDKFMRHAAEHYSFLFLGYSFEDEDVLWWLERASYETKGKVKGHYGLVNGANWQPYKRQLYRKRFGINMVDATLGADGYPDIEAFLHGLHAEYQRSLAARFTRTIAWPERTRYVDPQILLRSDKSIHSLDTFLTEWVASDEDGARQFLIILGEFGTGKTQFSYRACELIEKHCKHRAPVLIKLGEFRNGADLAAIAAASPDRQHFHDANRDGALVLILDAFDEMGKADPKQTLDESFTRLTEGLIEGNAKVILTCRKEFFRSDDEEDRFDTFGAAKASGKVIAASAEKVEIQLFDKPRIERALSARNRGSVLKEIENNPRMMDLASRPVLLDLIAQHDRPFDSSTKLASLYEGYIRDELRRGPDDKHSNQRRKFAEEIAWTMQNSGPMPAAGLEAKLIALGFMDHSDNFYCRSLLVRQVNDYIFGHASFREYLVAKQLVPYLQRDEFKECKLSDPTIQFIREMWTWSPPMQPIERDGMIQVPAGPFIFGEADSARIANIDQPFWIDKYPVTNQQYLEFLQSVGRKKIDKKWISHDSSRITAKLTLEDAKYKDHPVTGVSWFGAKAFAVSVRKRLPTEEEWEKATRGMDGRKYPWGDDFDPEKAQTTESKARGTSPVSQHENGKSPYGAVDMAGNVLEWTDTEVGGTRILRGGCWYYYPRLARCAYRIRYLPEFSFNSLGFRCART